MEADTPITLADLTKMSPEEREALLSLIRDRRMKPVRVYEELSLMQTEARKEQLETQWAKALEMFKKDLERADKAMTNVQQRATKLRALEMEIESI